MELREFIKNSLVDILQGIQEAQHEINSDPNALGAVNPAFGELKDAMTDVSFDIAVTASSEASASGKGGINVFAAKLDGSFDGKLQDSTVSRLQFKVPISPATLMFTHQPNAKPTVPHG